MNNISFPRIAIYVSFRFHLFVPTWTENYWMIMRQRVIMYQESLLLQMMKGNGGKESARDARPAWSTSTRHRKSRSKSCTHIQTVPNVCLGFEVSIGKAINITRWEPRKRRTTLPNKNIWLLNRLRRSPALAKNIDMQTEKKVSRSRRPFFQLDNFPKSISSRDRKREKQKQIFNLCILDLWMRG